jgi:hypothetical protein
MKPFVKPWTKTVRKTMRSSEIAACKLPHCIRSRWRAMCDMRMNSGAVSRVRPWYPDVPQVRPLMCGRPITR